VRARSLGTLEDSFKLQCGSRVFLASNPFGVVHAVEQLAPERSEGRERPAGFSGLCLTSTSRICDTGPVGPEIGIQMGKISYFNLQRTGKRFPPSLGTRALRGRPVSSTNNAVPQDSVWVRVTGVPCS